MKSKSKAIGSISKGGYARAQALSPEKRREIASNAANTRWGVPRAPYVGEIHIGETSIPCAVLEDGTRLLTQEGFLKAIGRSGKPAAGRGSSVEKIAPFLALENLKPFIDEELASSTFPMIFQTVTGSKAYGYKAELLPKVCEVYLKARDAGMLMKSQMRFANACEILIRGLAHVGIAALVDAATGYQEVRDRLALQAILDKYITDEWAKWTKTFPVEYYKELFRLHDVEYPGDKMQKPGYVGHWTNDIVYSRLAPRVLKTLREINPRLESGHRARKHHQYLTTDFGHPKLKEHLSNIIFLMKSCSSWTEFKRRLDRAATKYGDTIPLDLKEADE